MNIHNLPRIRSSLIIISLSAVHLVVSAAHAERKEVVILQTTDIHGHITESDEVPAGGGWLRIASLVRRERQRHGVHKTILIDCGDTSQGTLVACLSEGAVAMDLLDALRYDVWIPGNHELDFGVTRLAAMCKRQQNRLLAANFSLTIDKRLQTYTGWRILERNGARIAVIGLNSAYLKNWFWGDDFENFTVRSSQSVLQRLLPEVLAKKPDMIIVAAHQGWLPNDPRGVNDVKEMAAQFPEIDLFLGGHTHWPHPGRKIAPNTWYVQAGVHGDSLGVIHAVVDTDKHRVNSIQSYLVTPGAGIPFDKDALKAVSPWLHKSRMFAKQKVGSLATPVSAHGRPGVDCATSELLCRAVAEATNADAVVHGKLSQYDLPAGTVTERDLFELVPYENVIGIVDLTPTQLKEIVQEQIDNRESYVACGLFGIHAHVTEDNRVIRLTATDGTPLSKPVRTAFNSYTLASGGGRFPVLRRIIDSDQTKTTDTGLWTRDIVRHFLNAHPMFELQVRQWIVRDG